ncbi:MAG: hypothetical protein Q8Q12_21240 [bacterium]|nr:hypothetical protein [bacterium]
MKRRLIQDPQGADYWQAVRGDTSTSLGEVAVLSLAILLGDAFADIRARGFDLAPETEVNLCFSLPNWVGNRPEEEAARKRMFQTTAVVSGLLAEDGVDRLPGVGMSVSIAKWREQIQTMLGRTTCREVFLEYQPDFGSLIQRSFCFSTNGNVRWRLAAESCAAGFPQLQLLMVDPEEARRTQDHWVKLLVVDVGAGSTDAGYFMSSRCLGGEVVLNYLRPAETMDYAGEKLTQMLRDYYRGLSQDITDEEAELLKLSNLAEHRDKDFVEDWRNRIAQKVADYMYRVPDFRRLPQTDIDGLKIVMTGGSGMVDGLGSAVRDAVVEALRRRPEVQDNVANRTELVELQIAAPVDPIDRGRRAVSIGAGKHDFALLRYRERFDRLYRAGHN